jgi:hypothetical protein
MKEPLYDKCKDRMYWFVERTRSGGLALNISGMFYFIGNFVRLGIVLVAVFCFIGACASVIRKGLRITPGSGARDILAVRERLFVFSIIELWTKGLYFILLIHGKVWGKSCLVGSLNFKLAGAAIFIVGWIVLTIPRNFVEYRIWRVLQEQEKAGPREGMPDLRNQEIIWLYVVGATLFFLTAATLLVLSEDGPLHWKWTTAFLDALGLGWLPGLRP